MSEKESKHIYTKKSAWEIFTKDQIKKAKTEIIIMKIDF